MIGLLWPTRVRTKMVLALAATGLLTALAVSITVALAFQRAEREDASLRAHQYLDRVMALHDNLYEWYERHPQPLTVLLNSLVAYEPNCHLYLLDADGKVLAASGRPDWPLGARVSMSMLKAAVVQQWSTGFSMGDDPRNLQVPAVVAARPLRRSENQTGPAAQGYLYVVNQQPAVETGYGLVFRSSVAWPALAMVVVVVALGTVAAGWMTSAVTRPLQQLSEAVAQVTQEGLQVQGGPVTFWSDKPSHDEWDQLRAGFDLMLQTLRSQWHTLCRLDDFRREGVSNLSHDLRSPLTATIACLEILGQRWAAQPEDAEGRRLLEVALRNTHNAARLVQSLGELAQLDEPSFKLSTAVIDLHELVDDIVMRFADRARHQGITLHGPQPGSQSGGLMAQVDPELFERAMANLIDNALKFTQSGGQIQMVLGLCNDAPRWVEVGVKDSGSGIPETDIPHLFDRFFQSRQTVAPATGDGGKGLGLAIVQRIAELHGGSVTVSSHVGQGTRVSLVLPLAKS